MSSHDHRDDSGPAAAGGGRWARRSCNSVGTASSRPVPGPRPSAPPQPLPGSIQQPLPEPLQEPLADGNARARRDRLAERHPLAGLPLNRRDLLKGAAAGLTLAGLGGCGRQPPEAILPYVQEPQQVTPGQPLWFATVLTQGGYGRGVLVESRQGRPTKIEGNPDHPASFGATDVFAQAEALAVHDPERSRTVTLNGQISSWERFQAQVADWRRHWTADRGAGLALLTPTISSPALGGQLDALLDELPEARWFHHEPVGREAVYAGAARAFGRPLETLPDLSAERILCLDADVLHRMPGSLAHARRFADARRIAAGGEGMNRLYVVESTPTLTGAAADERLALKPSSIESLAAHLANALGLDAPQAGPPPASPDWIEALARDLLAHAGRSLVIAGDHQPAGVHALAHAMNARLGSVGRTLRYLPPVPYRVPGEDDDLATLTAAMGAGEIETLVIVGGNPVYDAPADLRFGEQLAQVPNSVHWGLYADETARAARWHIPGAHELECWGDARAFDGTLAIQQPLMRPVYGGRPPLELLATLRGRFGSTDHELLVADHAAAHDGQDFATYWKQVLHRGAVPGSAFEPVAPTLDPDLAAARTAPVSAGPGSSDQEGPNQGGLDQDGLELRLVPDPCIHDGRFAHNAWLQELPKPLTQLVWGNAALIAPETATALGLADQQPVRLRYQGRSVEAPLAVLPGQPEGVVSLSLGYGRDDPGRAGHQLGADAYRLRGHRRPWFDRGLQLEAAASKAVPRYVTIQQHWRMEDRHMVRHATLDAFRDDPDFAQDEPQEQVPEHSLYPEFPGSPLYQWGMSIDLTACIGCKACTIACQAENNIPAVGREESARGHEMHWIRVDRYFEGPLAAPKTLFQPVPCMHCEQAPCEYVCPVMATVHDAEGLNLQIYNRCIGTRDCSQNCPYKVRRFNWHDYNYAPQAREARAAQHNPEVTVRSRGVMEKCTYCVQRISRARIQAKNENRVIADGEIETACQQVCPTGAIVFGNLEDPDSAVSRLKAGPLDYSLLAELNTRPRTTYLARLSNPSPDLRTGHAGAEASPAEREPPSDAEGSGHG